MGWSFRSWRVKVSNKRMRGDVGAGGESAKGEVACVAGKEDQNFKKMTLALVRAGGERRLRP